jgi:hypothetical protein
MAADTAARMSYAAALVACVAYGTFFLRSLHIEYLLIHYGFARNSGIYVLLAFNTVERLIFTREKWTSSRKVLLAYTILLFVSETIYFIAASKWSAIEFVDAPVDPAIFAGELSSRISLLKDTMYVITIWIADSFIVSVSSSALALELISPPSSIQLYRTFIILGGNYLVFLPMVTYLGDIGQSEHRVDGR